MKKRFLLFLLCSCLALSACGKDTLDEDRKNEVHIGDIAIALRAQADSVLESLGEPFDYTETKSCLYDGYDKTYTYSDIIIITSPIDGREIITSLTLLSETVKHNLGIQIGDSADDILRVYSEDTLDVSDECYIWEGTFGIVFYLQDTVITEIEIYVL